MSLNYALLVCICQYVALQKQPQDFQEILDEILEIKQTFRSSPVFFIVGDMNSSMIERFGNERDKLLERFISDNSLIHSQDGTCT